MTLCVIDGKQCQCQPDEGVACTEGTPAEVQAAMWVEVMRFRKDAERYRKMRDLCAWSMMSRPGLVRLVFRLSGDFNFDDETGHEMDALIDATHAAAPAVG